MINFSHEQIPPILPGYLPQKTEKNNKGTGPLSRCYDDKMKLSLLKNTAGPHLYHS